MGDVTLLLNAEDDRSRRRQDDDNSFMVCVLQC